MSGPPRFGRAASTSKLIEGWCNRFAASFLIPRSAVETALERPDAPQRSFDEATLSALAGQFAVSRHAMMVKLVNLGYVDSAYYWRVKRSLFREEDEYEPPFMRSRYYGSRYKNSLGNLYTGLVLEAWQGGAISSHNAAEFMGIKNVSHLEDIRRDMWP